MLVASDQAEAVKVPSFTDTLWGKKALVTGGGTGIGRAIAEALAAAGATVMIVGRRTEVLETASTEIGDRCSWRRGDVSDVAAQAQLVADAARELGGLDILVNNAGTNLKKPLLELSDADFASVIEPNLSGLFALSREAARLMVGQGGGAILNIASMAAIYGIPRVAAYSASKTAVVGLTRAMAVELGPMGVRVNAISPGFIYSEMSARALDADPERKQRALSRTPLGRLGQPEEVASAAVYLCSDAASYVTGVNLCVDGGNSIGF